jgi:hypothetical protein
MVKPRWYSTTRTKIREAMMTSRHEFLVMLHELLQPKLYVETGVHTGESLKLANCAAIGIDPYPLLTRTQKPSELIAAMESDEYFDRHKEDWERKIDLGFIDGMHRFENAWRDFLNMEHNATTGSVIAFDDVLPYTKFMAARDMVPGDWTGDVWRVFYLLSEKRPDLRLQLVDTVPTGTLLVWQLDPLVRDQMDWWRTPVWHGDEDPPDEILFRTQAVPAALAIRMLEEWRNNEAR